ncbi:hypothetical protein GALMADRAFT_246541 [Galerina marginata CBS 339.88]|uniref:Beta-lactamase-related domain-containing protein n=1 Tax=Galerina marginata (strain CBS 339.88) TaxID=685588 RepID=A0A067T220_GALM3|nr:hypothetical protein GALMADRAFT_246541 [Galerina marginata CBS 339.88]
MTTISPEGKQALDNFIKETLDAKKVPGFVLGVSNIDGEIYFHGGGPNVVDDPASGDINADSVFWLCSQTKLIAALAALKLLDQGKINLDTVVGDYFPELRNPVIIDQSSGNSTSTPAKTAITVKHLLNFTSGLFYPFSPEAPFLLPEGYHSKDIHAAADPVSAFFSLIKGDLPGVPLKFEPGTDFAYGWSSDVLGFLVEKVSGQTLEQFCKEHIFNPLGMETSFYLTPELRQRLVNLSFREKDGTLRSWANQVEIIEQDPAKLKLHLGGVGLYSSMRDYLKLLRHLMQIHAGKSVANPILKPETVHEIWVPALSDTAAKSVSEIVQLPDLNWGTTMAIVSEDWPQRRKKGSVCWGGWAGTAHFIDPASGIAAVIGVQTTPPDMETVKATKDLEVVLYSALATGTA